MKLTRYPIVIFCIAFLCIITDLSFSQTTSTITSKDLRQRMNILASDSLAGRRTGEIGCEKAAQYIASEFKRIGLSPAGSSKSYFQKGQDKLREN